MKKKSDKSKLIKKLDAAFSQYIRLKYADSRGFCHCISCGKIYHWTRIQNGHYMSRRYMSTRYAEDNCRPQCVACNMFRQGNIQSYRRNLIKEIGEERVDAVEIRARVERKNYSSWELEELIKYYSAWVEIYKQEKGE